MKRLLLVLFVLGIALSGYAELKPKEVVGKWKFEVDAGGELITGVFKFSEKEGKLVGQILADDGTTLPFTKVEIKEGGKLHLETKTEYDTINIDVKVEGDKMTGWASNSEGEAPITCKRVKE
ncbi:MAG: hypothetical protein R3182_11265 [Draconibacterium sp.]|nr:hypothetical protein [Draconibacterium sp.]